MPPFKFRAQAALDLRKRQDDEAQRNLADATRTRLLAETSVDVASAAVDESMQHARKALQSVASGDLHVWHRNWIVSRKQELAVRREALAKSPCRRTAGSAARAGCTARTAVPRALVRTGLAQTSAGAATDRTAGARRDGSASVCGAQPRAGRELGGSTASRE